MALTCDWWFNVKCDTTAQLYVLNERLYKYILPFTPKFPEDYSGPLVDKYLALKFKEMEEKMRKQKGSRVNGEDGTDPIESEEDNDDELGGISSIDQGVGISKMDGESSLELSDRIAAQYTTTSPRPVPTTTQTVENIIEDELEEATRSNEVEVTRTPAPPPTFVASAAAAAALREQPQSPPLVEIISDGSSGHLTPRFRLRGER